MKSKITPFAAAVSAAFVKYKNFFGEDPHGTEKQMAAMVELMPDKSFAAAPELLDALKSIMGCHGAHPIPDEIVQKAKAAIAKAEVKRV